MPLLFLQVVEMKGASKASIKVVNGVLSFPQSIRSLLLESHAANPHSTPLNQKTTPPAPFPDHSNTTPHPLPSASIIPTPSNPHPHLTSSRHKQPHKPTDLPATSDAVPKIVQRQTHATVFARDEAAAGPRDDGAGGRLADDALQA